MNLTDIKEKELLKQWAASNENDTVTRKVLSSIDRTCESYWTKMSENDTYISEYGFENMSDLENGIKNALPDNMFQSMYMPLTIASFKLRQHTEASKTSTENTEDSSCFAIPDFVYNF